MGEVTVGDVTAIDVIQKILKLKGYVNERVG